MGGQRLLQLIAMPSGNASIPEVLRSITSEPFGQVDTPVSRYTLSSGHGMRVRILTCGGIIQSIEVPDRSAKSTMWCSDSRPWSAT